MDYESFFRARGASTFIKAGHMPCRGCGRCCREEPCIGLFPSDIFRISKGIGLTLAEFNDRYLDGIVTIGAVRDGKGHTQYDSRAFGLKLRNGCPFLTGDKCGIHAFKPIICRAYPNMVMRTFRGDILKSFVQLHEGCALRDLDDDVYILPDADMYMRLAFGVQAMQIYFERAGNAFDARLVDNLAHKEMAWLRNPGKAGAAEEEMDEDVARFVKSVEAAEAAGKKLF
ncbi:MAG: Flagellin N-methylase [Methanocella sp. PtaU1.Bin125]|nr:MAG: Flagellin N-methylase [Methanocella sp. PtaU1.Bin125]